MISASQNALYWRTWRDACLAQGWSQSDNSQRHAIHQEALCYDKSHSSLSNAEFDRVLAQFRLLINPDDLRAALALTDPDRSRRKRIEWSLRRFPQALVHALIRDKFDRSNLASLTTAEAQQLLMTLKRIRRNQDHPVGRRSAPFSSEISNLKSEIGDPIPADCPF